MTIKKTINQLEKEFEKAKRLEWVRNPLAYALYQVWKMANTDTPTEKGGVNNE